MTENLFPRSVRAFIAQHIHSVEQLEVLLLLRSRPEEIWTTEGMSRLLRSSALSVSTRLEDLTSRGFAEKMPDERYKYHSSDEETENTIGTLARAYSIARYRVIDMIFAKPGQRAQLFADAFRIIRSETE